MNAALMVMSMSLGPAAGQPPPPSPVVAANPGCYGPGPVVYSATPARESLLGRHRGKGGKSSAATPAYSVGAPAVPAAAAPCCAPAGPVGAMPAVTTPIGMPPGTVPTQDVAPDPKLVKPKNAPGDGLNLPPPPASNPGVTVIRQGPVVPVAAPKLNGPRSPY
jgi:hypothetical protein